MWHSPDLLCHLDRRIVGLHGVLRHDHTQGEVMRVSMEPQMHRHLIHAKISAIAHNYRAAQLALLFQQLPKRCALKWVEGVFLANVKRSAKGSTASSGIVAASLVPA